MSRSRGGERPRAAGLRCARSLLLVGLFSVASLATRVVLADSSVWARAREPAVGEREAALKRADLLLHEHREIERKQRGAGDAFKDNSKLEEARAILEAAGAASSPDPLMRYRLAEVLSDLGVTDEAVTHYEFALRSPSISPPLRAYGLTGLAICYARQGRHQDEIKAYTEALPLEPLGPLRAMILANRAEAYMVLGDLPKAVEGYRASLASLLPIEMFSFGVTTLWGLAVATDRSGDLESALSSIRLARAYDPIDRRITGPGWFYVPVYDDAWYAALGYWSRARGETLAMTRAEAYTRAIDAWQSYIDRAPNTDRWLAIAKARRRACEAERDAAMRRDKSRDPADAPPGRAR